MDLLGHLLRIRVGSASPELRVVYTQNQTPKLEKENYFSGHAWRSLSGSQLSNRVRRLQSQKATLPGL